MERDELLRAVVKELEWEQDSPNCYFSGPSWLEYEVSFCDNDEWDVTFPGSTSGVYSSLNLAQAAAEADYRARIAEAINLDLIAGLVDAAASLAESMRVIRDNTPSSGAKVVATAALRDWDAALAAPATEYERKVAQMKEDFPNGI